MSPRKILGTTLTLALFAATGVGVLYSGRDAANTRAAKAVVSVHGLIGSEKEAYFADPRVVAELRNDGLDVHVETSGSREMASRSDLRSFDFAFPAGEPAGQQLKTMLNAPNVSTPFFTPMAVASWKPIAEILVRNGYVKREGAQYDIVRMPELLAAEGRGIRWSTLKGSDAYPVSKSVLVSTTDPRTSNSGAMYLSLASYALNGNSVVDGHAAAHRLAPKLDPLFLRQGLIAHSTSEPFEDYVQIGMGKAPLVMIYEAQFIENALATEHARNAQMVLLYPRPTIYTKHTFVPIDAGGEKLGRALTEDVVLQHLAVEHGLRIHDSAYAADFWKQHDVSVPAALIDVVDPPYYAYLEDMIQDLDREYRRGSP